MAIEILMPALSPTMEEGTLAKWLVKEGDTVKSGQIIAEIETDKATMEFEAVDEGIRRQALVAEGTGREGQHPHRGADRKRAKAPMRSRGPAPAARREAARMSCCGAAEAPGALPRWRRSPIRTGPPAPDEDHDRPRSLREAMAEEMRPRRGVFLMGEEVGEVSGRLQDQPGPAGPVRRRSA
jgi:pyruvate dehydrogenase E1 component beta subunit